MSGLASVYSHHSENGPAYHNNHLGGISFPFPNRSTEPASTKISLNKSYVMTIEGTARLILIVFLLGGWIAAALIVADSDASGADGYGGFNSTRIAYLVFSISAFIIYIVIFVLELLNIFNAIAIFRKLPLQIIILGLDIFYVLTLFSVSVACAVRESQLKDYVDKIYDTYRKGAFAAASAFGFLACIILVALIILTAFSGFKSKQPARNNSGPNMTVQPNTNGPPNNDQYIN